MTARPRAGMVAVVLGSVVLGAVVLGAVAVFFGGDPVRSISDTLNETVIGRSETIDDWMLLLGVAGALVLILGLCLGITGRRPIPVDTTRLERPPRAAGLLPPSGVALDDSATVAALRRYARTTHLAGAACVVLLAGGVTLNVHLSSGQAELLRSGSRTEGVVTSLDTSGDSEVAIVRYTVGGRTYTGELGDPDDVIDLVANQPVVVIYDPAEPARFRTERYSNTPDNLLTSGPLIAGGIMTLVVPGAYWRLLSWRRRARRGPWQLWQASRIGVGTFQLPVMELIRRTPAGDETMRVKLSSGAKSVQDFSLTDTGMVQVMNDPGERHGVLLPLGSDHRPFAFIRPVTHRQDRRWLGSTSELGTPGATPIDGSAVLQRLRDVLGRRLGGRATTELTRDQHGRERLRLRPASNPRACPIEITYDEDCIYCSADRYNGAWERELDETETIEDICALVQSITDGRVWFRRQLGLRTQYRTQKSTADIPTGRGWQRHPAY